MTKQKIKKIKVEDFTYELKAKDEVIALISENSKEINFIFKKGKFPKGLDF